jgi:hypothetical protein
MMPTKCREKKTKVPDVPCSENEHWLMWLLLGELEKDANYKVLFGKKDPHEVLLVFLCCYGVLTWLSIERTRVER